MMAEVVGGFLKDDLAFRIVESERICGFAVFDFNALEGYGDGIFAVFHFKCGSLDLGCVNQFFKFGNGHVPCHLYADRVVCQGADDNLAVRCLYAGCAPGTPCNGVN